MSWLDTAKGELEKHSMALEIIEGIGKLVKDALLEPDSKAHAVLAVIEHAIETLIKGFDGKITRAEVDEVIKGLVDRRTARNAAFDARLDAKFEDGGTD